MTKNTEQLVNQTYKPTVMEIVELAEEIEAAGLGQIDLVRAALARWGHHPAPPEEVREVGELVEGLKLISDGMDALGHESDSWFVARAADLLEQRHPAPVPVAERLPGPEDCDAERRCWWFCTECPGEHPYWILAKEVYCDPIRWLPATALPLPQGEGEP